jgi:hypothetical protein
MPRDNVLLGAALLFSPSTLRCCAGPPVYYIHVYYTHTHTHTHTSLCLVSLNGAKYIHTYVCESINTKIIGGLIRTQYICIIHTYILYTHAHAHARAHSIYRDLENTFYI